MVCFGYNVNSDFGENYFQFQFPGEKSSDPVSKEKDADGVRSKPIQIEEALEMTSELCILIQLFMVNRVSDFKFTKWTKKRQSYSVGYR